MSTKTNRCRSREIREAMSQQDVSQFVDIRFFNLMDPNTGAPTTEYDGKILTVNNRVDISGYGIETIPAQFQEVTGYFDCSDNSLRSLKGCPKYIRMEFDCSLNNLASLQYGPTVVEKDYKCHQNLLESLEHGPKRVLGRFNCNSNQLSSLEYGPDQADNYDCSNNYINTIEYLPEYVKFDLDLSSNRLTSLVGIHKKLSCETIRISNNPIEEGGLGLLLIDRLMFINSHNNRAEDTEDFFNAIQIIKKYIHLHRAGILACQQELIDAGLERFAKL